MSTDAIVYPILFMTLAFVFWLVVTEMRRRSRLKMLIEFRLRLLDRLGSASEITDLLQKEGGSVFFRDPTEESSDAGFRGQVIRTAQIGIVLLLIGAALFVLAWLNSFGARSALIAFAIVAIFVAAGFTLSAALAWRLGVRSGLIDPVPRQHEAPSSAPDR